MYGVDFERAILKLFSILYALLTTKKLVAGIASSLFWIVYNFTYLQKR